MGGTYGDMVAGLINDNLEIDCIYAVAKPSEDISRLKKPHNFTDISAKDDYISSIPSEYKCIISHDQDYHFNRNHDVLGIVVTNMQSALKCANRFKAAHRKQVWNEMMDRCGAKNIEEYAEMLIHYGKMIESRCKWIITTDEIENGKTLERIKLITKQPLSEKTKHVYKSWYYTVILRTYEWVI